MMAAPLDTVGRRGTMILAVKTCTSMSGWLGARIGFDNALSIGEGCASATAALSASIEQVSRMLPFPLLPL